MPRLIQKWIADFSSNSNIKVVEIASILFLFKRYISFGGMVTCEIENLPPVGIISTVFYVDTNHF